MTIESFEGIIISETNYSESSKILNVLTDKYGLIGIMSKGCRNMKSKLRGVSRKLIHGKFNVYYKQQGISTLISIDLINSFSKTLMDLSKISYSSFILDLTNQVLRQTDSDEVFDLLKDSLIKIEEGLNPTVITNILELKLLGYLGVSPNLDSCAYCGSDKQIVTLSSQAGGYVCRNCYSNEQLVNEKVIKMIRMYLYVDIKKITKLDVSDEVTKEINKFLDDYYDRYTGLYIKSKEFIRQVNQISQK